MTARVRGSGAGRSVPETSLGLAVLLALVWCAGRACAAAPADDFDDNAKGSLWYQVEWNPTTEWLEETNQRLEFLSTTASDADGALYILRQRRFPTGQGHDFALQVDWHCTTTGGADAWVMLGVAADSDNWIEVQAEGGPSFCVFGGSDGVEFIDQCIPRDTNDGTLYISYDSTLDRLYLSVNGYWRPAGPNGDWVFDGLLGDDGWEVDEVVVYLGGSAEETAVGSGEAYLDNFQVTQGTLVEPLTRQLTVRSSPNPNVPIELRPEDNSDNGNGATDFVRTYDIGIPVFLTAPADDGQGKLFAGWTRDGQAWSTQRAVALAMDDDHTVVAHYEAISDHVFGVEICTGWDYDDPKDPNDLTYEFELGVQTDDTVDLVEFITPQNNTFQIPNEPHTDSGAVETYRYFENGKYHWWYEAEFGEQPSLGAYGDGNYTIRVYYTDGRQAETTVRFGQPGTGSPIPQPTQEPVLTFPAHFGSATSPVTFTWQACTDPAATSIWLELEKRDEDQEVVEEAYGTGDTESDPIALDTGAWEAWLCFEQWYEAPDNGDGIPYVVGKYSESDYSFAVNTAAPGTIAVGEEVWGYIGAPREIDECTFQATAGQELVIDVDARAYGSELDSVVILYGPGAGGPEIDRDDDSGDLAGDFGIEMELAARRQGNTGTPSYQAEVWVNALDSRLYFTVPQDGTYTIAIGDSENIEEGKDGTWGPHAFYRMRLVQASDLPEVDPATVQVTLITPGGGTETLACQTWDHGAEYHLEITDTQAALEARFPDGTYTVRADYGGADVRERSFDFGGPWPDFPHVEQPTDGQSGIPEPVQVVWQSVPDAAAMDVTCWLPDQGTELWRQHGLAADATTATIPTDATQAHHAATVGVKAKAGQDNLAAAVWKSRETRVAFQLDPAEPGPVEIDMTVMAGAALNPNGPAPRSLGLVGIALNGNADDVLIAIRLEGSPNGGWLRLVPDGDRTDLFADTAQPAWHTAAEWSGKRLRGLDPGTPYAFAALTKRGTRQSALAEAGTWSTNRACDANHSGLATAFDYAYIRLAILTGSVIGVDQPWACDANDDGAIDAQDLSLTRARILNP